MKKNSVLQAIADKMKVLRYEDPDLFQAMAEQSEQMNSLCSILVNHDAVKAAEERVRQMQALCARPNSRVRQAFDRIVLRSGINNLN